MGLAASSFNAAGIDKGDSKILVRVYQDGKCSAWSKADDDEVGNKKGNPTAPAAKNNAKQRWVIERWPCNYPKPGYLFKG